MTKSSRLSSVLCSSIQYSVYKQPQEGAVTEQAYTPLLQRSSYSPWLRLLHHQQLYGWSWTLKNICSRENNTHTLTPILSHLRTPVHKHTSHTDICSRKRHIIMSVLFELSTHTGWVGFSSVGHRWAMLTYNNVQPSFPIAIKPEYLKYFGPWAGEESCFEPPLVEHEKKIFVHETVGLIQ